MPGCPGTRKPALLAAFVPCVPAFARACAVMSGVESLYGFAFSRRPDARDRLAGLHILPPRALTLKGKSGPGAAFFFCTSADATVAPSSSASPASSAAAASPSRLLTAACSECACALSSSLCLFLPLIIYILSCEW